MFDIGFSELVVIGVVALMVFGPEELPRVARLAGHMLGKFRRYVDGVKSELSQEMEMAELRRLQEEVKDSARSLQNSVTEHLTATESSLRDMVSDVQQSVQAPEDSAEVPAPVTEPAPVPEIAASEVAPAFELTAPEPVDESVPPAEVPDDSQLDLFGMPVQKPQDHKVKADE